MKRTKPMLLAALGCLAALALPSCSNGLLKDPRLYNGSNKQAAAPEVAPEPELGFVEGMNAFDETDKWYNKRDSNGDEREPDKAGFDASEFDTIQITGWFSNQNVPTYTMTKKNVWSSGDAAKREFVHAGAPDTEGQGWAINGVRYYQYRGINPGYAADGNYNQTLQVTTPQGNPQLSRFYFYRFTGKGGGIQALDNYLIAVDTYSKLVFAFSEPVQFSTFGAPTKWDPTDNEKFNGMSYQFYMYDPVGYVLKKDDGSYDIKLYQWFQDNLAKGNYKASIQGFNDIAEKRVDGQGKSPFNNQRVDFFNSNLKLLAGKTFMCREKMDNGGYGLKKYIFIISDDGTKLTKKTEVWRGLEETPADVVYTIGDGDNATKGAVSGGDNKLGWLEIKDGHTLVLGKDGTAIETATTSFQDHGPDWLLRVRGQTYNHKDGYSFTFSEDGTKLTFKNPNAGLFQQKEATYTFEQQDAGNRAVYYQQAAVYWGFRLDKEDQTLYCTSTSWASASTTPTNSAGSWPAHLHHEAGSTFKDSVKNMTFSVRKKDGDGLWGLDRHSYRFSADGSTATYFVTPWQKSAYDKGVYSVTSSNATEGTVNGQKAILSIPEDEDAPWTLTIGSETYYESYSDPGPSFLNRVKGATYKRGNISYEFSADGKTLTYTIKYEWYDRINFLSELKESGTINYDEGSDKDNVIATYGGGYRVHLTENDTIIKLASVPKAGDSSDMRWPADRQ